jgi:hypothetical protein
MLDVCRAKLESESSECAIVSSCSRRHDILRARPRFAPSPSRSAASSTCSVWSSNSRVWIVAEITSGRAASSCSICPIPIQRRSRRSQRRRQPMSRQPARRLDGRPADHMVATRDDEAALAAALRVRGDLRSRQRDAARGGSPRRLSCAMCSATSWNICSFAPASDPCHVRRLRSVAVRRRNAAMIVVATPAR